MKWFSLLLTVSLISGMAFCAGCIQQAGTPAPVPATPATPALSSLALTAADAPVNYTLTSSRQKSADDVGSVAKDLGWEDGYAVTYTGYPDNPMGGTSITQTLTRYPAEHAGGILSLIETNDKSDKELVITNLSSPGIGEKSFAFSGKAISQVVLRPKTDDPLSQGSMAGSLKQDVVEIGFVKGSTIVILRAEGPMIEYEILQDLARKAAANVP